MLDAGIDVYTTLNVQHVDSLNDVVAQVTGVVVRERVPDRLLDEATEVRLIDLPPDELLERLGEGKVYLPRSSGARHGELLPQGEPHRPARAGLAPHRRAGRRADAHLPHRARDRRRVGPPASASSSASSPSPSSARLLRATRRMAGSLHADWNRSVRRDAGVAAARRALRANSWPPTCAWAEELGARAATASGENAAHETLRYARAHNVTKIVVGKPNPRALA